jgi:UDP-N-acetylmuramyl pentapeptide phosphotransferase/UDP-N-acetylglucosamine-1-phosphate transferase
MLNFSTGFIISFLFTMLIVRYAHIHKHFSADEDLTGAQKFHTRPVPRIGGIGIALAVLSTSGILWWHHAIQWREFMLLVIAGVPAFLAGLIEDVTKSVSPRARLIATMISALVAIWLLDARIVRIDIPWLDMAIAYLPVSITITALAVAGLANAVNIIDGFNGLASMVATMMFLSISYVALQVGDALVLSIALAMAGAILGFFMWNFPGGLIFLGDGGAYFIGFALAEALVLLVARNPSVSAWYPVLMVIYPIFETLFSIYRKKMLRGMSPGIPDGVHLHMLVYKRLMRWAVSSKNERHRLRRNSMTSPYLWLLSLLAVLPATLFWSKTWILALFSAAFIIIYIWLYQSIVRFRAPRWLIFRK